MHYRYFLFTILFYTWCFSQVLITEVMYDLPGSDSPNEFVELYNESVDTLSLQGWQIRDKYTSDDLVDTSTNFLIPPLSYFIIMEGDYDLQSGLYKNLIPENTPILFVDDASIGNGLSSSDSLYIIDTTGNVIDSVGWTDIVIDGYSIERIRLDQPNSPNNWAMSQDSLGTPGFQNSVYPYQIDGKIIPELTIALSDSIFTEEPMFIQIGVTNSGIDHLSGDIVIRWNSILIESISIQNISPLDTIIHQIEVGAFPSGYQNLVCDFVLPDDQYLENNSSTITFGVRYVSGIVSINEFLAMPGGNQSEFVECVNLSDQSLSLENWVLRDANSTQYYFPLFILDPNQYMIISGNSQLAIPDSSILINPVNGFPTLNNSGDKIRLYDPFGTLIDSLNYSVQWGMVSGVSMEKVFPAHISSDSTNWRSSVSENGSTVGYRNSVMPWQFDIALIPESFTSLPEYPQAETTFEISFQTINIGIQPISLNSIQVEINGGINSLAYSDNLYPNDTLSITVPMNPLDPGVYPINIFIPHDQDQFMNNNSLSDTILVSYLWGSVTLNEFMAKPNNDQTEFIEIVANESVNLMGWSIYDSRSQSDLIPETILLKNDYMIISPDSIITGYMLPNSNYIIDSSLPSLNNSGDAIKLVDHTGNIIDSLIYDGSWNILEEQSFEKLHPDLESSQPLHWLPSNHINNMTPGFLNSVTLLDMNGALLFPITHNPLYPNATDSIEMSIMVTNNGRIPILGMITLEMDEEEIGEIPVSELSWKDTILVSTLIPSFPSGAHELIAFFFVNGEEYPLDNIGIDTLYISYPFGSVLINEFMAIPESNQGEFVEIVNPNHLDLSGWGISDNRISIRTFPTLNDDDQNFLVIFSDSVLIQLAPNNNWIIPKGGFPGLSNTGDAIYIHDHTGFIVDSLLYNENWNLMPGRSLEKFRPEYISNDSSRWVLNINENGMTLGSQNSIYYESMAQNGELSLSPNPFSPDGDGRDDQLVIHFSAPFESPVARIECFDILGRKVKTLVWNRPLSQEDIIYWDGRDNNGKPCRIGIYLIKFELVDQTTRQKWEELQTVVLAKPL
ncbi:MAG: lamin tail domain-containing protein [Candidatus Marinimicrobia bacterium]|nr:lamin tail domain-containing protein [Candidatus Neomarinimicrobiota bacterium]